jgi:hypothetical protein
MKDHDLDGILSEEEILPSSGFAASVMDAVRREAAAPPSIPFPWKRALPGLVAAGLTLALIVLVSVVHPESLAGSPSQAPAWVARFGKNLASPEGRTLTVALLVTFLSLVVPLRIALRRG